MEPARYWLFVCRESDMITLLYHDREIMLVLTEACEGVRIIIDTRHLGPENGGPSSYSNDRYFHETQQVIPIAHLRGKEIVD